MGPIYFRVQSPLGQLTKQTWRMTGKIGAEQQFNWSRPIQLEDTEISMDLIERVQRELSSEERCIQISFYPFILVNLGLQLALQLDVFTTSWYVNSYTSCLVVNSFGTGQTQVEFQDAFFAFITCRNLSWIQLLSRFAVESEHYVKDRRQYPALVGIASSDCPTPCEILMRFHFRGEILTRTIYLMADNTATDQLSLVKALYKEGFMNNLILISWHTRM